MKESNDYLKSLNYFREAQQLELQISSNNKATETYNKRKANEFYERSLNIRYSYPAKLLNSNKNEIKQRSKLCMDVNVIWMIIFDFCDLREIELMSYLYPTVLYPLIKLWQNIDAKQQEAAWKDVDIDSDDPKPLFIPNIFYSFASYNIFQFQNADFFYENEQQCLKVAAIYAFALMSNKYQKKNQSPQQYIVQYNPYSQKVLTIPFHQLLNDVFYDKKCFGAYFKMNNDKKMVSHNLDRTHMSLSYGAQFVGGSLIDEENFKFKYGQRVKKDDKWTVTEKVRKISELTDDGIISHIRKDYCRSFKTLNDNDNLNNKGYLNDLIVNDKENGYQHPSYCRMFNANGLRMELTPGCNCTIHRGEGNYHGCTTKVDVYNQLVFDFTQSKLTVNMDADGKKGGCMNCTHLHRPFVDLYEIVEEYLDINSWGGWGYKKHGYPEYTECVAKTDKYYTVNIERLFDTKFDLSFYHGMIFMFSFLFWFLFNLSIYSMFKLRICRGKGN